MTIHAGAIPPGGFPIPLAPLLRTAGDAPPGERLRAGLRSLCDAGQVHLRGSGREALREILAEARGASGRDEVIVPAYTCFSVPSAAVAAGLRVRLVDTDERGWIDRDALARLPLDGAAALVVCNLFGVPEPVADLRDAVRDTGLVLVDDAAQSLGARGSDGRVGGRGDRGIASFGRGKPLQGLGGGAILDPGDCAAVSDGEPDPTIGIRSRATALARAAAFDASLRPRVFARLARIPALGIGSNHFDPDFRRGGIGAAALWLAAAELERFLASVSARVARAQVLATRIAAETAFVPLLAPAGSEAVHPRLALRAPDAAARDRALAALSRVGASALYGRALADLAPLAPHLAAPARCPGASELAARLLTLPTHGLLGPAQLDAVIDGLAGRSGPAGSAR